MARARRHAEGTRVPTAKSRGEIDKLLRDWDCDGVRWTDNFTSGRVRLEFTWQYKGVTHLARFELLAGDLGTEAKNEQEWRRLHRVLRVFLLAKFNAVDAGLVSFREALLPYIVGQDDRTIAQLLLPRLDKISAGADVGGLLLGTGD